VAGPLPFNGWKWQSRAGKVPVKIKPRRLSARQSPLPAAIEQRLPTEAVSLRRP
jgi:hypothetical protein